MKKKILIPTILLVLVVISSALFYLYSKPTRGSLTDAEKEEALTELLGRKVDVDAPGIPQGNTAYEGEYSSFQYPAEAVIYEHRGEGFASDSALLQTFSFDMKSPRVVFQHNVHEKSISVVGDEPAVKLRQLPERGYLEESVEVDGVPASVFRKEGSENEISAFILRNGILYSFSLTGSDMEEVERVWEIVRTSFTFKN